MYYSKILKMDIANSKSTSVTLFVSGCDNRCPYCYNMETWDFYYGKKIDKEVIDKIIDYVQKPYIDNFVITGGDPCHPNNISEVIDICKQVKKQTNKNIILYTGYKISEICNNTIFLYVDYIIDGKYEYKLKPAILDLRGSYNQKCYKINHRNNTYIDYSKEYFYTDEKGDINIDNS